MDRKPMKLRAAMTLATPRVVYKRQVSSKCTIPINYFGISSSSSVWTQCLVLIENVAHLRLYNALYKATGYKNEQDINLRHLFFNTEPALLIEANPYNLCWGCEFKIDDPSINDHRSYP
uniref:Uncharacterized protein n=1 Tax=Romanomermis culicivorax TaxID=13658 RepID=A0A915L6X2_ROMCU